MCGGGICAASYDSGFSGCEVGHSALKRLNFGAADGGKIFWVEEQNHVLSAVAVEGEFAVHFSVDQSSGGEIGSGVSKEGHGAKLGMNVD